MCEVVNVEVDLLSLDKYIYCFSEHENCDGIVAELNPNHKSDVKTENEDGRGNIEPIDFKDDMLPSIARHRALASELDNTTLIIIHTCRCGKGV